MTYFLKKKKWMAWVVLLTFLFTSFMPTNLLTGNSVASAEGRELSESDFKAVYVYMQVVDDDNNQPISEEQITQLGLTLNSHGWFTVGKLTIDDFPSAQKTKPSEKLKMQAVNNLNKIARYENINSYLDPLAEKINWKLVISSGANDYVTEDDWYNNSKGDAVNCWHLDGVLRVSFLNKVTINYLEKGTNKSIAEPNINTVAVGSKVTAKSISINGYQFSNSDPQQVTIEKNNKEQPDGYTINLYYTKVKNVTATKKWIDGNVDSRPNITVELQRKVEGSPEVKTVQDVTPTTSSKNNVTTYTWTDVPVSDENGKQYVYSVKETKIGDVNVENNKAIVNGKTYQVSYGDDGLSITNTLLTTVSGTKIWKHNGQTNYWPNGATVTVGLYTRVNNKDKSVMNGETAKTISVNAQDGSYCFSDLPKYDTAGKKITYVAKEQSVKIGGKTYDVKDGKIKIENDTYLVSDGVEEKGVYDITNTLSGATDVTITKTWAAIDNDGEENDITIAHPDNITMKVTGKVAGNNNGKVEKTYQIKKTGNGFTVNDDANKILTENTDYTAVKNDNKWMITFKNLPNANGEGKTYSYSVAETKISDKDVTDNKANGYVSKVEASNGVYTITNKPETAKLTIEKKWEDSDNVWETRPESVNFNVVGTVGDGNNLVVETPVTLSKNVNGSWESRTIDVPKYYLGDKITYLISESVPDGYEVSYKVNGNENATVTWTPAGGNQGMLAAVWKWFTRDSSNTGDNCTVTATNTLRTAGIKLTKVYRGGTLASDIKGKSNSDLAKFTLTEVKENAQPLLLTRNDDVYSTTSGALKYGVVYKLSEEAPNDYQAMGDKYLTFTKVNGEYKVAECNENREQLSGSDKVHDLESNVADIGTITNNVKTADFMFTKEYIGPQPTKLATFTAVGKPTATPNSTQNYTVNVKSGENTYTLENLKYGYTYTVTEHAPEGYVPVQFTVAVDATNGSLTVTQVKNTANYETKDAVSIIDGNNVVTNYLQQDTLKLFGTKHWVGGTTDSAITINLFQDGKQFATTTTSLDLNWAYSFDNLNRFNLETGKAYTYTVEEVPVDGYEAYYETSVNGNDIQIDITNVKDVEMIQIAGSKTWFDGKEPDDHGAVTIQLYQKDAQGNNTLVEAKAVSAETDWKYDFGLLPKVDENGDLYDYTIVEANVPDGYVSIVSGYDVHNVSVEFYKMGAVSVTKQVVGTPANNAPFSFNLFVKATKLITDDFDQQPLDAAQQRAKTLLAGAFNSAKDALKAAETALFGEAGEEGAQTIFENSVFLTNTSASSYQFLMTDENNNAVKAATTGSALYIDSVYIENLEKADSSNWDKFKDIIAAIVKAIDGLAEEFVGTSEEARQTTSRPSTSVMLSRIAEDKAVQEVKATTESAIAFNEQKLSGMFDAMVNYKQSLIEYENAETAWNDFKESITTASAIVLVVGDMEPIKLDPNSGTWNEVNGELEFTVITENENPKVTKVYFNPETKEYRIPFELINGETLDFALEATTGSTLQYKFVEEGVTVDRNWTHTYIYNGDFSDLEAALEADKALESLEMGYTDLATGSAISWIFQNQYTTTTDTDDNGNSGNDGNNDNNGEEEINDPDVPLAEPDEPPIEIEDPDVPLTDVPGEPIEIDEPEVPLGDAPKTGDSSNAIPFVVLMMVGITGLAITRRKFN